MSSVFCPDDGLPRLIRYVDGSSMPEPGLLALYDESLNLLIIDRELYHQLSPMEQRRLLRTTQPFTYATDLTT